MSDENQHEEEVKNDPTEDQGAGATDAPVEEKPPSPPPMVGEARFVSRERELHFMRPKDVLTAYTIEDVLPTLEKVQEAVNAGRHAAGYVAYEAAPAFDSSLKAHPPGELPLVWFGLFSAPEQTMPRAATREPYTVSEWESLTSQEEYETALARIRELIAAGDTYQVNYTFPLKATFSGKAENWFRALVAAQGGDHCAYIDAGRFKILSASPELFFKVKGDCITTRPMKGTRPRGLWHEADAQAATDLAASEKDQAENIMIVDLMRNDLGRICEAGSVETSDLYKVERYETLWQMTSTVEGRTKSPIPEIFQALFPPGSITGAPKGRTMEIIREIETRPRGVYCGAAGWISPKGSAEFNVAIRTVTIDEEQGSASYSVGSGITWDSTPETEYKECLTKAALLTRRPPDFSLLESLYYDGEFHMIDAHLKRLAGSAKFFGMPVQVERIRSDLYARAKAWKVTKQSAVKVRLMVARTGAVTVDVSTAPKSSAVLLGFARDHVESANVFLYHKTTCRDLYETALCTRPDCNDVLLWNERGEITESAQANVVFEIDGRLITPPVRAGLLPGTMRAHLLAAGQIEEGVIMKDDVEKATRIWLVNSVRKWIPVIWRGEWAMPAAS
jgi:para-aminobenzoate synthetase/4-amino-4-deoxychorismate lyase